MRFLPDIRYGTENYPEKVARRLRAVNLIAWSTAALTIGFTVVDFAVANSLDPNPGVWKHVAATALAASICASIPFVHRFGALWGALILASTLQAYLFSVTL